MYSIYILMLEDNPVYVGCSKNVKERISKHRKNKNFDSYLVLRSFKDRKKALDYEKGIIDFMNVFNPEECLNNTHQMLYWCKPRIIRI